MTTAEETKVKPLYMNDPDWKLRALQALRDLGIAVFLVRFGDWPTLAPDIEVPAEQTARALADYARAIQNRAWVIADTLRRDLKVAHVGTATKNLTPPELLVLFGKLGNLEIEAGQCIFRESKI